jgi:hypothetical protein
VELVTPRITCRLVRLVTTRLCVSMELQRSPFTCRTRYLVPTTGWAIYPVAVIRSTLAITQLSTFSLFHVYRNRRFALRRIRRRRAMETRPCSSYPRTFIATKPRRGCMGRGRSQRCSAATLVAPLALQVIRKLSRLSTSQTTLMI